VVTEPCYFSIWLMKSLKDVFCVQQFRYLFQIFYDMVSIGIKAYVTCDWMQWYVNCHWLRKELYPQEMSIKASQLYKSNRKHCHICIAEGAAHDSDVVWILLFVFTLGLLFESITEHLQCVCVYVCVCSNPLRSIYSVCVCVWRFSVSFYKAKSVLWSATWSSFRRVL
jgi:hypothetical protein